MLHHSPFNVSFLQAFAARVYDQVNKVKKKANFPCEGDWQLVRPSKLLPYLHVHHECLLMLSSHLESTASPQKSGFMMLCMG